jgi:hypothetical protein
MSRECECECECQVNGRGRCDRIDGKCTARNHVRARTPHASPRRNLSLATFATCRLLSSTTASCWQLSRRPILNLPINMADDIVIDKQLFHERLSSLVTKWKADKRSGDQIFQGAGSIAAVVGKPSDPGSYLKPAAFQVSVI